MAIKPDKSITEELVLSKLAKLHAKTWGYQTVAAPSARGQIRPGEIAARVLGKDRSTNRTVALNQALEKLQDKGLLEHDGGSNRRYFLTEKGYEAAGITSMGTPLEELNMPKTPKRTSTKAAAKPKPKVRPSPKWMEYMTKTAHAFQQGESLPYSERRDAHDAQQAAMSLVTRQARKIEDPATMGVTLASKGAITKHARERQAAITKQIAKGLSPEKLKEVLTEWHSHNIRLVLVGRLEQEEEARKRRERHAQQVSDRLAKEKREAEEKAAREAEIAETVRRDPEIIAEAKKRQGQLERALEKGDYDTALKQYNWLVGKMHELPWQGKAKHVVSDMDFRHYRRGLDSLNAGEFELEPGGKKIYLKLVNQAIHKTDPPKWMMGMYTNPDRRRGSLGYVEEGLMTREQREIAISRMKDEAIITRDALELEKAGKLPSAAQPIGEALAQAVAPTVRKVKATSKRVARQAAGKPVARKPKKAVAAKPKKRAPKRTDTKERKLTQRELDNILGI